MKLKGPELKMPELDAQAFLANLFHDLRDRRLLAPLALVVVAIAAVPFLLGGGSEGEEAQTAPEAGGAVAVAGASSADSARFTVVESKPGLRDYHKRLGRRRPIDPFKQKYTNPVGTGAGSSSQAESSSGSKTTASTGGGGGETTEVGPPPSSGSGSTPQPGGSDSNSTPQPADTGVRYFAYRPDIRFGVAGSDKLKTYEALEVGTRLPQKKPVLVFLGVSDDGKRATFAVMSEVLVRGSGKCIGGGQSCVLVTLGAGDAVDLISGVPNRNFRLSVTKIQWLEVDRPKPANSSAAPREPFADFSTYADFSQNFSK